MSASASSARRTSSQRQVSLNEYNPTDRDDVLRTLDSIISREESKSTQLLTERQSGIQAIQDQIAALTLQLQQLQTQSSVDGDKIRNARRLRMILSRNDPGTTSPAPQTGEIGASSTDRGTVFCRTRSKGRYDCSPDAIDEMVAEPEPYAFYYVQPKDLASLLTSNWTGFASL